MSGTPGRRDVLVSPDPPQVASIELIRVRVPLRSTHRSSHLTESARQSVLVRITDVNGVTGTGECPALGAAGYVVETIDVAWSALSSDLAPSWLAGRHGMSIGAPCATAAMADASLDLWLRSQHRSLADWLGVDPARPVRWCAVLADVRLDPQTTLDRAREAVDSGASMVKLKFDDPATLRRQVAAVRSELAVPLAADANGTLDPRSARKLDDLALTYLEQPLPVAAGVESYRQLREDTDTPVALDESLTSLDALAWALRNDALDLASVKPARMGGLVQAANAIALCSKDGVGAFVGGMFELGVGRAGGLVLASLPGCSEPTDLGPSQRYFDRDVVEPLRTDDGGAITLPSGPGLGRVLDEEAVDLYTVDRLELR